MKDSTTNTPTTGVPSAGRRSRARRAAAVAASSALLAGVLSSPVVVTAAQQSSTDSGVTEQTVAWGVPAWMPRMFWNQVNKQHTTPRCIGEWCGDEGGVIA